MLEELSAEIEAYVDRTLAALAPCAGAVVVSQGSETVWERYFPSTGVPPLSHPIAARSRWYIYSVTKSFAAALLLNLVSEGVTALDDPVVRYLPEFAHDDDDREAVTVRHLASHTAGVALPDELAISDEPKDIDLSEVQIRTEPGSAFNYSQLGMITLERAIEAATGEDFGAAMRSRVLAPLGLHDTHYLTRMRDDLPLVPIESGAAAEPERAFPLTSVPGRAGTGLYTTARDLNRFGRLWLGEGTLEGQTIFTPALQREAWTLHGVRADDGGRYGLLWWLFEGDGGYVMSGAAHSLCAVVPETQAVVTILRNHRGPHPGEYIYYDDKRRAVEFGRAMGV